VRNHDRKAVLLILAAGLFLALGCQKTNNPPAANEVFIENFSFNPAVDTVTAGTAVTWINRDNVDHEIRNGTPAQPESLFHSSILAPNDSFSFTFDSAGTFPYYCVIHSGMTGTVVVQ
jgi:plastocyanin